MSSRSVEIRPARLAAAIALVALTAAGAASPPQVSDLKADEVVVFYPSYLTWDPQRQRWIGSVHGNVHEPSDGATAAAGLASIRALVRLGRTLTPEEDRYLRDRASEFLVDNERGKTVVLRVGTQTFASRRSRADGHFIVQLALAEGAAGDEMPYRVVTAPGDPRLFAGTLRLLAHDGVSVISDIDDTVKDTNVLDHSELLANTFLRPYRPIAGMPELYREWGERGVAVHYLTGSPWQLYPSLWGFLTDLRLSGVEIQMRELRVKDMSAVRFLRSPRRYKTERLREILRRLPGRTFVLIGDTGEDDPEIYAALAAAFPDRVRAVFLRAVREEDAARDRYRDLFEALDEARWLVFRDPSALPRDLPAWLRGEGEVLGQPGITDPADRGSPRNP